MTPSQILSLRSSLKQRGFPTLQDYKEALCNEYDVDQETTQWYISMCCEREEDVLELLPQMLEQHSTNRRKKEKRDET